MTLFMQAYNSTGSDFITMDDIGKRAADRFADSIATNSLFYYGPYTGMVARNAGYAFAGRLLANHTVEHPEGLLSVSPIPYVERLELIQASQRSFQVFLWSLWRGRQL